MEQTHPNVEAARQSSEAAERQSEALNQEAETTLSHLDSSGDIDATQYLVSSVTELSPAAHADFCSRQAAIGNSFLSQLQKQNEVAHEVPQDIIAYFNLDAQDISQLQESLDPLGLDISRLLSSFKNYIETRLADLPEEHKAKIRRSIGIKTGNIGDIVEEIKSETKSDEEFRSMRWILNEKIGDAFNFYTEKLFPTIGVYLALEKGETVPSTYESKKEYFWSPLGVRMVETNPNAIDVSYHMKELGELLDASVDSDGDFNEGFFSTQSLINTKNEKHAQLSQDMGVTNIESISLLNEADEKTQAEAMLYYLFAVGLQCLPYVGGVAGAAADGVDIFSDHDATLSALKQAGLVDSEFCMEKTTLDRVFAGLGIILTFVGLQSLTKSKKLAKAFKALGKLSKADIGIMLEKFAEKMKIGDSMKEVLKKFFSGDAEKIADTSRRTQEKFYQPNLAGETVDAKTDSLVKMAEATKSDYNALMQDIGARFNASEIKDASTVPLKERAKVIDKARDASEQVDGLSEVKAIEAITDVLRGSLVFEDIDDLRGALTALENSPDVTKIFVKERLDKPLMNDMLINVQHKNGFVSEIQLHIRETLHAKEHGYILGKDIINVENLWTPRDLELIDEIKQGTYGGRSLKDTIQLPRGNDKAIVGHDLYEIRRAIPNNAPPELQRLSGKVQLLEETLFNYARDLYTQRSGKDFL